MIKFSEEHNKSRSEKLGHRKNEAKITYLIPSDDFILRIWRLEHALCDFGSISD